MSSKNIAIAVVLTVLISFLAWVVIMNWFFPVKQLSLPLLCVRCNGGPQGDLDCYLCGGTGTIGKNTMRRGW